MMVSRNVIVIHLFAKEQNFRLKSKPFRKTQRRNGPCTNDACNYKVKFKTDVEFFEIKKIK